MSSIVELTMGHVKEHRGLGVHSSSTAAGYINVYMNFTCISPSFLCSDTYDLAMWAIYLYLTNYNIHQKF